jgi:hypothetical protein
MGYSTDFFGEFDVTPALTPEHSAYLTAFAGTRRVKRDEKITAAFPDPLREAVGLPVGPEGSYYVGSNVDGFRGQGDSPDILDGNTPPGVPTREVIVTYELSEFFGKPNPSTRNTPYDTEQPWAQPGLWCQWVPGADDTTIRWDEGEKFYHYVEWIRYLIDHFLKPWGYTVSGEVEWAGEEHDDRGLIVVENNKVFEKFGRLVYG